MRAGFPRQRHRSRLLERQVGWLPLDHVGRRADVLGECSVGLAEVAVHLVAGTEPLHVLAVMESRAAPTPVVLEYIESMIGMFRAGGLSVDLTHHVIHALGSRMFGFTQELFDDSATADPAVLARRSTR